MRLKFEEWIESQKLDNEAMDLFEESIVCYKASAYRAALLLSFLGFQTVIKYRIINSKTPVGYQDGEWNQLKKNLSNDDIWDKQIIDLIQSKKKPIFKISEDLREQYLFWKNRRNDCAHAKGNIISYPHIEGFWLFIQSNLPKFVVNGGIELILQDIRAHFDPARTPIGTSIVPIIKKIPSAIEKVDFNEFLNLLKKFTDQRQSKSVYLNFEEDIVDMYYQMLSLPDPYNRLLVEFLVEKPKFTLKLIRVNANILKYFNGKDTFIRILWKQDFSMGYDYTAFIELIKHNLIPEEQLQEAFTHIFNTIETSVFDGDAWWITDDDKIDEMDKMVLMARGFFSEFNKIAFEQQKIVFDFNWANRNKELLIYYIKEFGLNDLIVTVINKALRSVNPPFKFRDDLRDFYKKSQNTLIEHIELSKRNDSNLPKSLEGLLKE